MSDLAALRLNVKSNGARALRGGHPWVFRDDVANLRADLPDGAEADVFDHRERYLGRGLISAHSQIVCRIYSRQREPLGRDFFRRRLAAARDVRVALKLPQAETNGFREVFAEGDRLSGLIVDRYGDYLVLQTTTAAIEQRKAILIELLDELHRPHGICERNDLPSRRHENLPLHSGWIAGTLTESIELRELGIAYRVNPLGAMKTGHFFDQRQNRLLLAGICKGGRVLDAFCSTGGFGLAAAKFGARSVLSVDSSAAAIEQAAENAALNGVEDRISYLTADGFEALKSLVDSREQFDCVVLDPPAFAKRKTNFEEAARAYRQINRHALMLLRPGGRLLTCSCSYHIGRRDFREILRQSCADASVSLRLESEGRAGGDHPVLLNVPETDYLKALLLQAMEE